MFGLIESCRPGFQLFGQLDQASANGVIIAPGEGTALSRTLPQFFSFREHILISIKIRERALDNVSAEDKR